MKYQKTFNKNKRLIILILIICLITIFSYTFVFRNKKDNPRAQLNETLNKLSGLILLPENEEPTLATVDNPDILTDPQLKAAAKTGDKVLLYYTIKKVIVYRPSVNKIVDIFPLILDPSVTESLNARIEIRSGNGKPETSEQIKNLLAKNYKSLLLGEIGNASRQDYPSTIIVDLTDGQKYNLVNNLIKQTGASRGVLPNAEPKPENVDILIITGEDYKEN